MKTFLVILLSIFPLLFSHAETLVKEDARVYREEGYKIQALGDLKNALVWYQKAVILNPQYAEAYNDLGVVYETMGNNDKALEMYKKVLEIDPEYLPVYTNLAFIYEKKGDVGNAAFYWQKRYELGQKGSYWWEVSRQRLLKIGIYPRIRAVELSREIIQRNEQKRLKLMKTVKLHFNIGNRAFLKKDYETAKKEFEAVFLLNPPDEEVVNKSISLYKQSKRLLLRKQALAYTKSALDYIKYEDYLSAQKKLKDALRAIFHITQRK